eukprot:s1723_g3.t1
MADDELECPFDPQNCPAPPEAVRIESVGDAGGRVSQEVSNVNVSKNRLAQRQCTIAIHACFISVSEDAGEDLIELRTGSAYACGGLGALLLAALAISCLKAVPNLHYGIRYNHAQKYADVDNIYTAGRYFIGPWSSFVIFPAKVQNVEFSNTYGLAASGLALNLEVSLQYRLRLAEVGKLYTEFNVDFQDFFVSTIRDTLIKVAADYEAYQLWDQRKQVGDQMQSEVNAVLGRTCVSRYHDLLSF